MHANRIVIGASLAIVATLVAPGFGAATDAAGTPSESPPTDAVKPGTATWKLYGVLINADSGNGQQSGVVSGPYGDGGCICRHEPFGVCQIYSAYGEWRVTWNGATWDGKSSDLRYTKSASRAYPFSAESGWLSICSAAFTSSKNIARGAAGIGAGAFTNLGYGPASGATGVGVTVPIVNLPVGTPQVIATSGNGNWNGGDLSWSFSYSGSAKVGTAVCSTCLTASGQSNL